MPSNNRSDDYAVRALEKTFIQRQANVGFVHMVMTLANIAYIVVLGLFTKYTPNGTHNSEHLHNLIISTLVFDLSAFATWLSIPKEYSNHELKLRYIIFHLLCGVAVLASPIAVSVMTLDQKACREMVVQPGESVDGGAAKICRRMFQTTTANAVSSSSLLIFSLYSLYLHQKLKYDSKALARSLEVIETAPQNSGETPAGQHQEV